MSYQNQPHLPANCAIHTFDTKIVGLTYQTERKCLLYSDML